MRKLNHSSGDLTADRRAAYAAALAGERDFAAAAELMGQALELVPNWAGGWSLLGGYLEEAGDLDGAVTAWRRLEALDGDGVFGARLKLAAHGAGSAEPSAAYVEALFDDYAPRFDAALTERLGYGVPGLIGAAIGTEPVAVAIDLGCGTGLMGPVLRPLAGRLEGVDLSEGMLAEARRKGFYDLLVRGDLVGFLAWHSPGVGLVTASDVLNYTGPLPPVLEAVRRALAPGGRFAFSLETHEGPEAVLLRTTLRYAHSPEAALGACREAGFEIISAAATELRRDRGAPVMGLIVVLVAR